MSTTPNYGWPLLATNQASPEVTHNAALLDIDSVVFGVVADASAIPNAAGVISTTTGTITTGTNSLVVASATGWVVGMGIAVANAGTGGIVELITSVTAIVGTTFTLATNALATATGQTVNHDDTAAIAAAIAIGSVRIPAGNYNITSEFTISAARKIEGAGPGETILWVRFANVPNAIFHLNYQITGGATTVTGKGCVIRDLEISQAAGITPTHGFAINVGSASGTGFYTVGAHIENIHVNNLYGGIYCGNALISNWFRDIYIVDPVAYGIYYDCPEPGGDVHFENIEMTGANGGLTIIHADTMEFTNLKINGSQITFASGGTAADISRVRFVNPSVEGSPTQSVDFGTHGCTQIQFIGGCLANATLTNLANAIGLQIIGTNIGNSNTATILGVRPSLNTQSGTSYSATVYDDGNVVTMNNASASTFTVATGVFPIGAVLTIIQLGAGQVTLTPSGVTMYTASSLTTRAQYSTVSLTQVATDVWIAAGDLT